MKICDFDVENAMHDSAYNADKDDIQLNMRYKQKYVFLDIENKLYELEIEEVTNCSFILKLTDKELENIKNDLFKETYDEFQEKRIQEVYPLKKEGIVRRW